jgi:RNA polymerase sigma-70 factor (ECF subfamily)
MNPPPTSGSTSRTPLSREELEGVRSRSESALDAFFEHFFDRVFAHVARLVGNPLLAEDLTQEAFLRMHRGIDQLDPARDPAPWVFTVVSNTVRDYWRSRQHRARSLETDIEQGSGTLRNGRPQPDRQLEEKEDARAIRKALDSLSESDREILLLRNREELNASEIAQVLQIKPEAVRQRHSRAVARLAKAYERLSGPARGNK